MKFERENPQEFNPIVITLTTKQEAQALRAILASVVSNGLDGGLTLNLYRYLNNSLSMYDHAVTAEGTVQLRSTKKVL